MKDQQKQQSDDPNTETEQSAVDSDVEETSTQHEAEVLEGEVEAVEEALDPEQELQSYRDAMLRMQAEMDNLRKRLVKDLDRSRKRALERIMNDLLPVKDSLERGMEVDEETATVESMKEGKALIIRMLGKVMDDHGLQEIDPAGQVFNPELHQAMAMVESADHEPNTVMEVMQKGYQLNDRLIRPAMVVVSKAVGDN